LGDSGGQRVKKSPGQGAAKAERQGGGVGTGGLAREAERNQMEKPAAKIPERYCKRRGFAVGKTIGLFLGFNSDGRRNRIGD